MLYLGSRLVDTTVYVPFNTFNSSGASVIISAFEASDIKVYKNGSITQRSSEAGYTLLDTDGINFDGFAGMHGFSINLSDNTDAGFFAAGNHYMVAAAPFTADGQTINAWLASFDIIAAPATLADINAEVVDVIRTDTNAEPTGVPAATATLQKKVDFIYEALRNQVTVTATKMKFFDDASAAQWEKDLSDDGTTYTETEGNAI